MARTESPASRRGPTVPGLPVRETPPKLPGQGHRVLRQPMQGSRRPGNPSISISPRELCFAARTTSRRGRPSPLRCDHCVQSRRCCRQLRLKSTLHEPYCSIVHVEVKSSLCDAEFCVQRPGQKQRQVIEVLCSIALV